MMGISVALSYIIKIVFQHDKSVAVRILHFQKNNNNQQSNSQYVRVMFKKLSIRKYCQKVNNIWCIFIDIKLNTDILRFFIVLNA